MVKRGAKVGAPGSDVDEDWLYCLGSEKGAGVAYLRGLRILCERCHLAKHQGYAAIHRRSEEALDQLAKVNGVSVNVARSLVRETFAMYRKLSVTERWTIRVGRLEGMDEGLRAGAKRLMNALLAPLGGGSYTIDEGYLVYTPGAAETNALELRALRETAELLSDVLGRLGAGGTPTPEGLTGALAQVLAARLGDRFVVDGEALRKLFLDTNLRYGARRDVNVEPLMALAAVKEPKDLDPLLLYNALELLGEAGGSSLMSLSTLTWLRLSRRPSGIGVSCTELE